MQQEARTQRVSSHRPPSALRGDSMSSSGLRASATLFQGAPATTKWLRLRHPSIQLIRCVHCWQQCRTANRPVLRVGWVWKCDPSGCLVHRCWLLRGWYLEVEFHSPFSATERSPEFRVACHQPHRSTLLRRGAKFTFDWWQRQGTWGFECKMVEFVAGAWSEVGSAMGFCNP